MMTINQDIGEKPALCWIDVDRITVDSAYQREIDGRKVEKILAAFHWDHFGAIVVARGGDGTFIVTDGQHRVKAAQLHPAIDKVPAIVNGRRGTPAEAENFLVINRDRKPVTAVERYWAGLAAGDFAAIRLKNVVAAAGCEIAAGSGAYKPGVTNAVGAIARSLTRYGDRAVRLSLEAIRAAFPKDAKALRGTLISASARIIEENRDINLERFTAKLAAQDFVQLTAHAESFRKLSGGSAETALARTLVEIYNRGLSANQIYFRAEK